MQHKNTKLEFWIDINLPPSMKTWIIERFEMEAKSFSEMGFQTTDDVTIFNEASKKENVIIITTKDTDYIYLRKSKNTNSPKVLHINTGNISKADLKKLVYNSFENIIRLFIETNHLIVELNLEK